MFDLYLSVEQQNRERQDLDAINEEANRNSDLHSDGKFDGVCGLEPSLPQEHSYWSGYCVGLREYWSKKLNVEIPTEF